MLKRVLTFTDGAMQHCKYLCWWH